jgi:hypothetical protein
VAVLPKPGCVVVPAEVMCRVARLLEIIPADLGQSFATSDRGSAGKLRREEFIMRSLDLEAEKT